MNRVNVTLPYGETAIGAGVPATNLMGIYQIAATPAGADEAALLENALAHPIGTGRLKEVAAPGKRVAIVISDLTRPCPSDRMLPAVLGELQEAGVADDDITIIVALGLHRPMSDAELETAVGPAIYRRVVVVNHDPADCAYLGQTSRGTPIELYRPLVEADLRVCLGNLEFHYFAGFSGGAKAILPGCASRATINANHAMMVQSEAAAGRIAGNPVRADIEEGVAVLGCDFIFNAVVDERHRIVGAVAGHVIEAHRRGCEMVAQRGRVMLPAKADIVLVSAGGYPKDVNLYQAQKALDNAAYAVRDGGIIILLAECREGFGNATFESWLREAKTPGDLLAWIQREFVLGGHKAAAIGAVLQRASVHLISDLPAEEVSACGMTPFTDVEAAIAAAVETVGPAARIAVIPAGGSVLPAIEPA